MMNVFPDTVRWYLTLLAITAACAPVARLLAGRLPDRGAFIAKPVGLLAVVWPLWFLASITPIPYRTGLLWITLVLIGAAGWGMLVARREIDRSWLRHLMMAELIAVIAFAGYAGLRGYTPQLSSTEKPMDMALLASSARATDMPPPDPWMAGESINYYYLGYLENGSLARMSGVPVWTGFNLALASTFAMALTAAAGLGYTIVRSRYSTRLAAGAGALSAFLIIIAGNLKAPLEFIRDPHLTWDTFWFQGVGWQSTRVVVDNTRGITINEFPSFSFILGDLHPHVMALPYTLVALAVSFNLLHRTDSEHSPRNLTRYAPLLLAGAVIGALYPLNSWDYPTYLVVAIAALFYVGGWTRSTLYQVLTLGFGSVVAWAPFWLTFVPFAGGNEQDISEGVRNLPVLGRIATTVAVYSGNRTDAGEFLTIFGVPWLIAMAILTLEIGRRLRGQSLQLSRPMLGAALVLAVVALGLPAPVLILAGVPLAAAVWLLTRPRDPDNLEVSIISALLAAGFALILITEFFYIRDDFANRMNTLFKVYYQVWTLTGLAAALALMRIWRMTRSSPWLRSVAGVAIGLILLLGIAYPVISAQAWSRWQGPREWRGLDSAEFIETIAPDDLAAFRWLATNARPGDVVLESPGCSYSVNSGQPTGRIATFTGVPNVIGWTGHESQWRGGQPDLLNAINVRVQAVTDMFADPANSAGLDRYGVTLLYIGSFERAGASGCDHAGPFPSVMDPGYPGPGWTEVFSSGEAKMYRRDSA